MYLRQTPATASVPIIMVTTETEPRFSSRFVGSAWLGYVTRGLQWMLCGPSWTALF